MRDNIQNEVLLNSDGTSIGEILSVLKNFELLRLEYLKHFKKVCFYVLAAVVLLGGSCLFTMNCGKPFSDFFYKCMNFAGAAAIVIAVIFPFYISEFNKKFIITLKAQSFKSILKTIGDIQWCGHDDDNDNFSEIDDEDFNRSIISDSMLQKSGLFLNYNVRDIDDEFRGNHLDIPFKISETRLSDEHHSGKHHYEKEIFKGVIISFKLNKQIRGKTIITPKWNLIAYNQKSRDIKAFVFGILGILLFLYITVGNDFNNKYQSTPDFSVILFTLLPIILLIGIVALAVLFSRSKEIPLNKIKLENTEFTKRFNVYSSNEAEARNLVTPTFMEQFDNLKNAFGTGKVKCSFFDNKLMIAINTKRNLFEIGGLFRPLGDIRSINRFYKEINFILKMVEYFKLNEKSV